MLECRAGGVSYVPEAAVICCVLCWSSQQVAVANGVVGVAVVSSIRLHVGACWLGIDGLSFSRNFLLVTCMELLS